MTSTDKYQVMIADVLTFPLRGVGRYMLIIGGVLLLICWLVTAVPLLGTIIVIGFFGAYYFDIVNSTACGKNEACDWPDVRNFWGDIVSPWFCMLSAYVCSFAPLLVIGSFLEPQSIIRIALYVIGFAHLPMALLSVAIFRDARAAFWSKTIPAIMQCLPQYAVLLVIFGLLTIANFVIHRVLSSVPVAGRLVSCFVGMYALMMSARLLGLFYRDNSGIFDG